MTPRGTDWSIATAVVLLGASGLGSLFAATPGTAWVIATHTVAGFALLLLLWWKFRRVLHRLVNPRLWDRRTAAGATAFLLVAATLGSGIAWSSGANVVVGGFWLLVWHGWAGAVLVLIVAVHMTLRAKLPRRGDLAGRRELFRIAAVTAGGLLAWRFLPGGQRRFTGSYAASSFSGNSFPATSWVSDGPRPLDPASYRLRVEGEVREALAVRLAELEAGEEIVATLDCTGGFYSTQRWSGIRLDRLLERAGALPGARHVRVISVTGYRWSFDLDHARKLWLATHVGGERLAHEHGAPARLVAPGRRGFQWVKWVERVELHEDPDYGAPASTVWSSLTDEGRGKA